MNILGIDPGIARTGWGVIDYRQGSVKLVGYGCIETSKDSLPEARLVSLYRSLVKLLRKYKPRQAAIEQLFFNTNAKTAIAVGQARGVALLSLALQDLPLSHYTPLQVKIAITGYGRADKNQMQQMTKTLLCLETIPKPDDAADALSIALTHAYTKKPEK